MWYKNIVAAKHTSAIIALWLPKKDAQSLCLNKKDFSDSTTIESSDDLHITLVYLGKADELKDKKKLIELALENIAKKYSKIKGKVQGAGYFSGDGVTKPFYASYDCPDLPAFRQEIVDVMESLGVVLDNTHGFTPHITLAYLDANADLPNVKVPDIKINFNEIVLCWAENKITYPLS
jgi:2'-5' RNA ligase